MFYRKLFLILFILCIICLPFSKAESPFSPGTNTDGGLAYALGVSNAAERVLLKEWNKLDKLEIQYAMLGVQWDDNNEDLIENAIALGNAVSVDVLSSVSAVITATSNSLIDIADAHSLSVKMANKAIEISYQNVATQSAINERDRAHAHYTEHYNAYVKKFSASKKYVEIGETPSLLGVGDPEVPCGNPNCDTVYKASEYGLENIVILAEGNSAGGYMGHLLLTCSHKHGTSGETDITYWTCDSMYCPRIDEHWVECKGGCGENGPKVLGKLNYYKNGGINGHPPWVEADIITIFSHIEQCGVPSKRKHWLSGSVTVPCFHHYHKCNSSNTCPNSDNHVNQNEDNEGSAQNPSPSPDPPSTPTMHACGVHETTVSGSHASIIPPCGDETHRMAACQVDSSHSTVQASCSVTNSYGDYCTVSSYYECQYHSHQYPTRVVCRRSACDDMLLSEYDHRVDCLNGHRYWSCNSSSVTYHKTRTCSRQKIVRQVWNKKHGRYEARWGTCGESWAMCRQRSCKDIYGAIGKHQE